MGKWAKWTRGESPSQAETTKQAGRQAYIYTYLTNYYDLQKRTSRQKSAQWFCHEGAGSKVA